MGAALRILGWTLAVAAVLGALSWTALMVLRPDGGDEPGPGQFDVGVRFVTTRAELADKEADERFGGARGSVSHGRCVVRFDPIPGAGDLADDLPFHVPTTLKAVIDTRVTTAAEFRTELDMAAAQAPDAVIVVFVHGYAYGFGRACRMGASLQQFLGEETIVVMFTWPSDANPAAYVADQVDVEWSVPDLAALLADLSDAYGADRLRLLAHSLGSRGTLFSLNQLRLADHDRPIVSHVVLLAPDFDGASFVRLFPDLRPMARHWTLYASSHDAPLALSATLHGQPRLGQAGEALTVVPGMETIDVTSVGRYHPSGHEYHYYHPRVVADLAELLTREPNAAKRAGTRRRVDGDIRWWELDGD